MGSGLLDDNCFTVSQQQINTKWHYTLFVHVHERSADAQQKQKKLGVCFHWAFHRAETKIKHCYVGHGGLNMENSGCLLCVKLIWDKSLQNPKEINIVFRTINCFCFFALQHF